MLQVAFTASAAAIAAVRATRAAAPGQSPARDILLLHPRGRLSLHIGARHICDVSVRASDASVADGPLSRLLPVAPAGVSVPGLLQQDSVAACSAGVDTKLLQSLNLRLSTPKEGVCCP